MQPVPVRFPSITLPEPLSAAEVPSFTNYSVVVRLPEIARRTLADNNFTPKITRRVEELINEIPDGKVRLVNGVPTHYGWNEFTQPYHGLSWLEVPWFFAEEYFYLRMLEACGYFEQVSGSEHDPYALQKQLGLVSTRGSIYRLASQVEHALEQRQVLDPRETWRDSLTRLLLADLWGNQNDLSMWPVEKNGDGNKMSGGSAAPGNAPTDERVELSTARAHVLADDTDALLGLFDRLDPAKTRIDIVLDNAGYELVADLALADFLLGTGRAVEVVLHTKCYPVFVSDALDQDIQTTLDCLCFAESQPERSMAMRIRGHLVSDRLRLRKHPFWTSPLPAWEMPADLVEDINRSSLLIWKGDANYRRLLGDRHWPTNTRFADVVSYFQPAVLALRTCKSEIAVGIATQHVPLHDKEWMYDGKWGLIQFAPAGKE